MRYGVTGSTRPTTVFIIILNWNYEWRTKTKNTTFCVIWILIGMLSKCTDICFTKTNIKMYSRSCVLQIGIHTDIHTYVNIWVARLSSLSIMGTPLYLLKLYFLTTTKQTKFPSFFDMRDQFFFWKTCRSIPKKSAMNKN